MLWQPAFAAPSQPVAAGSPKPVRSEESTVKLIGTDIRDREVLLYAQTNKTLNANEIKREAIKLARTSFGAHKGATRFKVTIQTPRDSNQVSISIGDVRAIEGKLVTEDQIISSIEITPSRAMASTGKATTKYVSHLPTAGLPSNWVSHAEPTSGIVVWTPAGFTKKATTEKDCLLKIAQSDGMGSEISLASCDPGITPELASNIMEQAYLANLQNYKKLKEERIAFGTNRKIDGLMKDFSFSVSGMNFRQRLVLFRKGDRTYTLSFVAPQSTSAETELPSFSLQVLSNVSLHQAPAPPPSASSKTDNQSSDRFVQYRSEAAGIQFYYPSNWTTSSEKDALVSLKHEGNGKPASLNLYQGEWHPDWSIESGAAAIEERYFATQKNYRRTEQDSTNCGSASAIPAVHQVSGFDLNNVRTKQMIVYFRSGNKLSALALWTIGWSDIEMRSLFQKIIHTLSLLN